MHISVVADKVFEIGHFGITNSLIATYLVLAILSVSVYFGTKNLQSIPTGFQNILEYLIESLYKLADSVTKNRQLTKRIFPFIATIFLFILFNNWFGLLPGVGAFGIHEQKEGHEVLVPILRAGTADLNTTIALGIITVIFIQTIGIISIGFLKYGKKFINFSSPINFFIGIIEILSELVRIISFAFRLFGNVFAGEVLLVILISLAPYIAPVPFYFMEIFVGFIQALVFTMLALVFITMAATPHESH